MRWVRGLRECAELAQQLHGVRPVSVMDREGTCTRSLPSSGGLPFTQKSCLNAASGIARWIRSVGGLAQMPA